VALGKIKLILPPNLTMDKHPKLQAKSYGKFIWTFNQIKILSIIDNKVLT